MKLLVSGRAILNATITLCHSKTVNLEAEVRRAQLVVGAIGKPNFIPGEWISDGAIVVDAGYHVGGVGDIESGDLLDRCASVTPVPGGVGPMTISTLIIPSYSRGRRSCIPLAI
ncbi:hypothetical protein AB4Y44_09965 [Paraburkholderia sp. BR10937]|uniref:hypothetical protein n=1 Tax=Paraburkholderia sp. BR10937 TaxID=3236994 RepID=UPI0034D20374